MSVMKGFFLLAVPGVADLGMLAGEKPFSMTEANKLARLTQLSYCEPDQSQDVLDWTCETCLESTVDVVPGSVRFVHGDASNNSQVVMGKLRSQPGCFLSFRGSHTSHNWMKDFQIWFYDSNMDHYPECDGCKVHFGFYTFWQNLRDDVNRELDAIGCKDESGDPVYITGHSLGGAIAHLAAFTLRDRGYKIALMYSFEAPRIGNANFANTYNALFNTDAPGYRITHDHDPAVHTPPEFMKYRHVNTEVYFGATGSNYRICPQTEDPNGANQNSNVFWDMHFTYQHCGAPAFGDGFDLCTPKCKKANVDNIVV